MKKVCVTVVLGLVAVAFSMQSAKALPPFNKEWVAKYVEGNSNAGFLAAAEEQKCNVCHIGKSKKDHNRYGVELKKLLNKTDDKENVAKIQAALDTVAAIKVGDSTYGELINSGELPGGNPPVPPAE